MTIINGTPFDDYLVGTKFADFIQGFDGDDVLYGLNGNDTMLGGNGNDLLNGGNGNDYLLGGLGNDLIIGENGNDYIKGEAGMDNLYGGAGNDTILGGDGNDLLNGYTGNDYLAGGPGDDRYTGFSKYTGHDTINDTNNIISQINTDRIFLNNFLSGAVKFRAVDLNYDGNFDALKISLSSSSDITILNYFAGTGGTVPGPDASFILHFADQDFNFMQVINHLGNILV